MDFPFLLNLTHAKIEVKNLSLFYALVFFVFVMKNKDLYDVIENENKIVCKYLMFNCNLMLEHIYIH